MNVTRECSGCIRAISPEMKIIALMAEREGNTHYFCSWECLRHWAYARWDDELNHGKESQ